jgi:hypothetical protein
LTFGAITVSPSHAPLRSSIPARTDDHAVRVPAEKRQVVRPAIAVFAAPSRARLDDREGLGERINGWPARLTVSRMAPSEAYTGSLSSGSSVGEQTVSSVLETLARQ